MGLLCHLVVDTRQSTWSKISIVCSTECHNFKPKTFYQSFLLREMSNMLQKLKLIKQLSYSLILFTMKLSTKGQTVLCLVFYFHIPFLYLDYMLNCLTFKCAYSMSSFWTAWKWNYPHIHVVLEKSEQISKCAWVDACAV